MRLADGEALARFRAARVARLATVGASGLPHLVPVAFAMSDTEPMVASAVDHKPKTTFDLRRLRNIGETGRVSILADEYDEDWSRLWWVRLDGHARILADTADRAAPVGWLVAKYPQYQSNPPQGPVILIGVTTVRGWSYAD